VATEGGGNVRRGITPIMCYRADIIANGVECGRRAGSTGADGGEATREMKNNQQQQTANLNVVMNRKRLHAVTQ